MKNKIIFTSLLMLSLLVTPVARAEDATTTDDSTSTKPWQERMQERRELMKENIEERRGLFNENADERKDLRQENRDERRGEMMQRFDDTKKQIISRMIGMMSTRMMWAIERLENIATRIETRIIKIEGETGTTLTEARAHLTSARTHIAAARTALEGIDTTVVTVTTDATSTDDGKLSGIRAAFATVKEEIKAAWSELKSIIPTLKGLRVGDDKNDEATTTTER